MFSLLYGLIIEDIWPERELRGQEPARGIDPAASLQSTETDVSFTRLPCRNPMTPTAKMSEAAE